MRIGGEVCTVKFWRIGITFLLVVAIVDACSIAYTRQLWSKKTGSKSNLFAFEKNGLVGFINASGKVVVDPTLAVRIEDVGDFSDGRARVKDAGYIDETGKLVIAGEYRYLYDFSDGLAQVFVNDTGANGRNSQFVDPEGKAVAMVRTEKVYDYSENLAAFEVKGKPGVRRFKPGDFFYRDYPGLKGFVDKSGKVVIEPTFAQVGPFSEGLAQVALDGYCHLAFPNGGKDGTPTTGYPGSCGGAPADAKSPCAVGFINPDGKFAIEPGLESARDFSEQLAAVRIKGLWGITIVPFRSMNPHKPFILTAANCSLKSLADSKPGSIANLPSGLIKPTAHGDLASAGAPPQLPG